MAKLTTEEFIKKAQEVHGDKYDYSQTVYLGTLDNVRIICPEHGEFLQAPHHHLRGSGCPKCGRIRSDFLRRRTNQSFIEQAKLIHGDRYDYSKVEYINGKTPVILVCPKHGDFKIIPNKHIHRHQGCPLCSEEKYGHKETYTQEKAEKRLADILKGTPFVLKSPFVFNTVRNTNVDLHCSIHDYDWTVSWHELVYHQKDKSKFGCKFCKIQYSQDVCREAALKCQYRSEFEKKYKGEYFAALRNGWLDEICSHMIVLGNHYKRCIYAYEFPNIDGHNYVYVGLTDHLPQRDLLHARKGSVYKFCKKHKVERPKPIQLTEYIDKEEASVQEGIHLSKYIVQGWQPLNRVKTGSLGGHLANDGYTFEDCKIAGQKYKKRSEWKRYDYSTYYIASKRGWIDDIIKQKERFGNARQKYWTEKRIAETALKYKSRREFQRNEPSAYARAWKIGILDKVCGHMKHVCHRLDYNIDMIKRKIGEYDYFSDFIENNKSMRAWFNNHKIDLKELTDKSHRKSKQDHIEAEKKKELLLRNLSTLELIKDEIDKYETLSDFIANNKTMCGWLTKHKMKLRDISDKPYKKKEGPSKPVCQYTLEGEFVRRYNNARETEQFGFKYRDVSQVCHGKRKSHKGYIFRFE